MSQAVYGTSIKRDMGIISDLVTKRSSMGEKASLTKVFILLVLAFVVLTVANAWFFSSNQQQAHNRYQTELLATSQARSIAELLKKPEHRPTILEIRALVRKMADVKYSEDGEPMFHGIRILFPDNWYSKSFHVGHVECDSCEEMPIRIYSPNKKRLYVTMLYYLRPAPPVFSSVNVFAWLVQLVLLSIVAWRWFRYMETSLHGDAEIATQIFDSSPIPLLLRRDRDGYVLRYNHAALLLLGSHNLSQNLSVASFDESTISENVNGEEKPVYLKEAQVLDAEGIPRSVRISQVMLKLGDQVCSLIGLEDISEHKNIEQDLAAQKDKAEAANRSKSAFLAAISHEIRTPLGGIVGFLNLLSKTNLSGDQLEYIEMIDVSARNLTNVIEEILDFSSIEAGKLGIVSKPILLRSLVDESIRLMSLKAEAKSIVLLSNLASDVPPMMQADPHRLRQILIILIDNAIKYSDRGAVQTEVRVLSDVTGRQWIEFAVVDTGMGIARKEIANLFKPFYQVDQGIERRHGGAGLGLAIAKKLVGAMGGSIKVNSVVGKGSRFSVQLPLSTVSQQEFNEIQKANSTTSNTLGSYTALIIDDDRISGTLLRYLLQARGMQAYWVDNAQRGLEMIDSTKYDIVFADFHMPGMSGLQLLECLLERQVDGVRTHPPLIVTTADVQQETRTELLSKGMDDFIAKPIDEDILSSILERYLRI